MGDKRAPNLAASKVPRCLCRVERFWKGAIAVPNRYNRTIRPGDNAYELPQVIAIKRHAAIAAWTSDARPDEKKLPRQ